MNRKNTFANPNYVVHSMLVSKKQVQDMQRYMQGVYDAGVGFDSHGMYLAALPVQTRCQNSNNGTFCSRYVTEVLQNGGVEPVMRLNASLVTPSKLFKILHQYRDNTVAGSVDYKEKQFMQNARLGNNVNYMRIDT